MNRPEITPELKVSELLNYYPELENRLIEILPTFEKLKNPVLRKTIARVTTLNQASKVGNVSLGELINSLRTAAGYAKTNLQECQCKHDKIPEWVKDKNVKTFYDAGTDIEQGLHPIGKVFKEIEYLEGEDIYLLVTPFLPSPLIDKVSGKGYETYTKYNTDNEVWTYIRRMS